MRTTLRQTLGLVAASVLLVAMMPAGAQAVSTGGVSPRIGDYSIRISPQVAQAGQRVVITVSGVYIATSCRVTLIQGKKRSTATLPVKSFNAKARVVVPRTFLGETVARVACGKDGTATSSPFAVVSPNEPKRASCDVVDYGFTQSESDYAYLGLQVRNSSPSLSASNVEIALTYRDASGRVVKTDTISHSRGIPPSTMIILADSTDLGQRAASVEVIARCATSVTRATPVLPSSGYLTDDDGSLQVIGEVRNTLSRTIERYSEVFFLIRDPAGSIVGGGSTYLDSFAMPGAVSTWDDYFYGSLPASVGYSIEADVFPSFED